MWMDGESDMTNIIGALLQLAEASLVTSASARFSRASFPTGYFVLARNLFEDHVTILMETGALWRLTEMKSVES
jgi:hypothetical protein